jgi:hypothetical protein
MSKPPGPINESLLGVVPARRRALSAPVFSLVARSLVPRSVASQSEDRGAPFGSRGDYEEERLVRVFGDYLAAELALNQGHAGEFDRHRGRHVLVVEVKVLVVG